MKFAFLLLLLSVAPMRAAVPSPGDGQTAAPPERTRLYNKPDPACTGGIRGSITQPNAPLEQIVAIPTDAPENAYEGVVRGPRRDSFEFRGLPPGKYDLVAVYPQEFYEGCKLNREASSLTPADLQKIQEIIQKSEPYFTRKIIHRVEGVAGVGNPARCICTFLRDKDSQLMLKTYNGEFRRGDFRRTFKLVLLKNVGPGWQVVRARDLYPIWVTGNHALEPKHHFSGTLSQIRVADEIKDIGSLSLTQ